MNHFTEAASKPSTAAANRRTKILLGMLLAVSAFYGATLLPSPGPSEDAFDSWRSEVGTLTAAESEVIMVRTADLGGKRSPVPWSGRSIFDWGSPRLVEEEIEDPRSSPGKRRVQTPSSDDDPPSRALKVSLRGIFGPERLRIAVLEDEHRRTFNALEEDVIQDGYVVRQIDRESVSLRHRTESSDPIELEFPDRR